MTLPDRRLPPRPPLPHLDATLLASVFRVTARRPSFVGHRLAELREAHGQTPAAQAAELGIPLAALACLCLCRRPRPGCEGDDLAAIAARVGLRVERLRELLGAGTRPAEG